MKRFMHVAALITIFVAALLPGLADAASAVLRDPALPEALRHTRPAPPSEGVVLQAQVDAKLRSRFEAADSSRQGHISRAQAEAAGLGFVARHFDAIDSAGHGSVSWAQVQAYLKQRQRSR
jgi:hypothetical protein